MADFRPAFLHVLVAEGGWRLTNRRGDAGGVTYAGIAQGRNPHWSGFPLIQQMVRIPALSGYERWPSPPRPDDPSPPPPAAHIIGPAHERLVEAHPDVEVLRGRARDFFEAEFWTPLQAGGIEDQEMANAVYSEGVLSGIGRAARLIQAACGAPVDGHIGPQTLEAINGSDLPLLRRDFCLARWAWYIDLAARRPSDLGNLRGWRNRAAKEAGI